MPLFPVVLTLGICPPSCEEAQVEAISNPQEEDLKSLALSLADISSASQNHLLARQVATQSEFSSCQLMKLQRSKDELFYGALPKLQIHEKNK